MSSVEVKAVVKRERRGASTAPCFHGGPPVLFESLEWMLIPSSSSLPVSLSPSIPVSDHVANCSFVQSVRQGEEWWSFLPPALMPSMKYVSLNPDHKGIRNTMIFLNRNMLIAPKREALTMGVSVHC